jgi:hypothetical protein
MNLWTRGLEYGGRYLPLLAELEGSRPENALVQASLVQKARLEDKASDAAVHLPHAMTIGPLDNDSLSLYRSLEWRLQFATATTGLARA